PAEVALGKGGVDVLTSDPEHCPLQVVHDGEDPATHVGRWFPVNVQGRCQPFLIWVVLMAAQSQPDQRGPGGVHPPVGPDAVDQVAEQLGRKRTAQQRGPQQIVEGVPWAVLALGAKRHPGATATATTGLVAPAHPYQLGYRDVSDLAGPVVDHLMVSEPNAQVLLDLDDWLLDPVPDHHTCHV